MKNGWTSEMETSGGRRSRTDEGGREVECLEMRERAGGRWVEAVVDVESGLGLGLDVEDGGNGGGGRR